MEKKATAIDALAPAGNLLQHPVGLLRQGGIVVFPTTGLYGLGGDATRSAVVERVFHIKQRPPEKLVLILVKNRQMATSLVRNVSPAAMAIMENIWPGGVTLVMEAAGNLPLNLTAGTGKIGIRIPRHPVATAILDMLDFPVTGTSANLSGYPGCSRISSLDTCVADLVDGIVDAGPLKGGTGSTIVDVTGSKPVILREGSVPAGEIYSVVQGC